MKVNQPESVLSMPKTKPIECTPGVHKDTLSKKIKKHRFPILESHDALKGLALDFYVALCPSCSYIAQVVLMGQKFMCPSMVVEHDCTKHVADVLIDCFDWGVGEAIMWRRSSEYAKALADKHNSLMHALNGNMGKKNRKAKRYVRTELKKKQPVPSKTYGVVEHHCEKGCDLCSDDPKIRSAAQAAVDMGLGDCLINPPTTVSQVAVNSVQNKNYSSASQIASKSQGAKAPSATLNVCKSDKAPLRDKGKERVGNGPATEDDTSGPKPFLLAEDNIFVQQCQQPVVSAPVPVFNPPIPENHCCTFNGFYWVYSHPQEFELPPLPPFQELDVNHNVKEASTIVWHSERSVWKSNIEASGFRGVLQAAKDQICSWAGRRIRYKHELRELNDPVSFKITGRSVVGYDSVVKRRDYPDYRYFEYTRSVNGTVSMPCLDGFVFRSNTPVKILVSMELFRNLGHGTSVYVNPADESARLLKSAQEAAALIQLDEADISEDTVINNTVFLAQANLNQIREKQETLPYSPDFLSAHAGLAPGCAPTVITPTKFKLSPYLLLSPLVLYGLKKSIQGLNGCAAQLRSTLGLGILKRLVHDRTREMGQASVMESLSVSGINPLKSIASCFVSSDVGLNVTCKNISVPSAQASASAVRKTIQCLPQILRRGLKPLLTRNGVRRSCVWFIETLTDQLTSGKWLLSNHLSRTSVMWIISILGLLTLVQIWRRSSSAP